MAIRSPCGAKKLQPSDALVERLTGEASLAEQISVLVDTICPQVTITLMIMMVSSLSASSTARLKTPMTV